MMFFNGRPTTLFIRILFILVSVVSLYMNLDYIVNLNHSSSSYISSKKTNWENVKVLKWAVDENLSNLDSSTNVNSKSGKKASVRLNSGKLLKVLHEKGAETIDITATGNFQDLPSSGKKIKKLPPSPWNNIDQAVDREEGKLKLASYADKSFSKNQVQINRNIVYEKPTITEVDDSKENTINANVTLDSAYNITGNVSTDTSNSTIDYDQFYSLNQVIDEINYQEVVDKYYAKHERTKNYSCEMWTYEPAEMTLKYLPQTVEQDEPCSYPHNETVKKIITSNKEVIWKGCTQKTKMCLNQPHFDHDRNVRINVPPCCRHHLAEMLGNFDNTLARYNVSSFLVDGALIGWYRNKQLVPYDNDIDMIVEGVYWNTETWDSIIQELSTNFGYYYQAFEDYKGKIRYSKNNELSIDIWPFYNIKLRVPYPPYEPGDVITTIYHAKFTASRYDEMFPPKRTTISGASVSVPRDTVTFLNRNYGPNGSWLEEKQCTNIDDDGHCAE